MSLSKIFAKGKAGEAGDGLRALPATHLADDPYRQKVEKNNKENQTVIEAEKPKNRLSEKPRVLVWEQVNTATWRLVEPDGPQTLVPRSRGQWPAFKTPVAVAWIFDVGVDKADWRVRIRKHGGWRAFGCVTDLETAKRIAFAETAS